MGEEIETFGVSFAQLGAQSLEKTQARVGEECFERREVGELGKQRVHPRIGDRPRQGAFRIEQQLAVVPQDLRLGEQAQFGELLARLLDRSRRLGPARDARV